jgi:spore coat polysaccharide biosynthesis protein SpsF
MTYDYAVLIQARMGSSRAPGKISHKILGKEMLFHQISRLQKNNIKNILIVTSENKNDDVVENIANRCKIQVFRGSEDNVLERYYLAAKEFNIKNVIRIGGDDPLIDPVCIHSLIEQHKRNPVNFIYASHKLGWIYGTAAELIEFEALEKANKIAISRLDKEHVVTFIKNNPQFTQARISPRNKNEIRPDIFLSVDYPEDLDLIDQILIFFNSRDVLYTFTQAELIELYDSEALIIDNRGLHEGFKE